MLILDIKVVDTVPAPVGMYRTGTYTGIETLTFRTGLNTGRYRAYWPISSNIDQYRIFFFFF